MATHRFTDAAQFRSALALKVPRDIRDAAGRVYFDAVTQFDEELTRTTPVDKGYLRASKGVTVANGEGANITLPSDSERAAAGPGAFLGLANEGQAAIAVALVNAARGVAPLVLGFRASYAPFVEDRRHMLKNAVRRWAQFNASAVAHERERRGGGA